MKGFFKNLWLNIKLLWDGIKFTAILWKEGEDDV